MSSPTEGMPCQSTTCEGTTWTHDLGDDLDALLARLESCDGVKSEAAVILHEKCQLLVREFKRLRELLTGEGKVLSFSWTPEDGSECQIEHWAVKHLAASVLDSFKKSGAENFAIFTLHSEVGALEITIRPKSSRKTPGDVISELRARVAFLEEVLNVSKESAYGHFVKRHLGD